jgi:hypothetical protein
VLAVTSIIIRPVILYHACSTFYKYFIKHTLHLELFHYLLALIVGQMPGQSCPVLCNLGGLRTPKGHRSYSKACAN